MDKWWKYIAEERRSPKRSSPASVERSMRALLDTGPEDSGPYDEDRPNISKRKSRNDISAPPGAPGGLEEESPRRGHKNRIRRYTKDRDELLNVGGQKNTPPYTQKMGSHVTFDKQLEEEVEPESFERQGHLEPRFWQDTQLKPKIARRLEKIAGDFIEALNLEVGMEDLRFTGSLANYNWSKYSDIDLHIVVDFSKIDENTELVKGFFDSARMRWNDLHDIIIHGHEVEIYVENAGEIHRSSGIYSIMNGEWNIEPNPEKIEFDYSTARKKADAVQTEVNLIEKFAGSKPRAALKSIERLKQKIRKMRIAGLHSPDQEYSAENIAFKILRREETLDRLSKMQYDAYDSLLSIGD